MDSDRESDERERKALDCENNDSPFHAFSTAKKLEKVSQVRSKRKLEPQLYENNYDPSDSSNKMIHGGTSDHSIEAEKEKSEIEDVPKASNRRKRRNSNSKIENSTITNTAETLNGTEEYQYFPEELHALTGEIGRAHV